MKVSLGLPTHRVDLGAEMIGPGAVAEMSDAAEKTGFDAVFITDHPFPGDRWLQHGGHHALDPMVALSFAAAATERLRLQTNLYILAYRNPFLSAKAVASLDVLSGGRVILGIGAGYLESEFEALGIDFDRRNELTDEAVRAMKAAWAGESVSWRGLSFSASGNSMLPRPTQTPHPPIWVGGNSKRAIRRAVELADGWAPMPNPARSAARRRTPPLETLDDLSQLLDYARQHAADVGRHQPLEVVFMPMGGDMFSDTALGSGQLVDEAGRLAEAGVTYLVVSAPGESRSEFLRNAERLAQALPEIDRL